MKFAIVDNKRQEAAPHIEGKCINCGSPMVPKCGALRIKHWAHKGTRRCDPWWENETEWHRSWKNQFPTDWQEIVHYAENNEKHIADVKTLEGWVIEFQHSPIKPEERLSREDFYQKLIWVVDGKRRSRDERQFFKLLGNRMGRYIKSEKYPEVQSTLPEGQIYRDWTASRSHVFFDFGGEDLWWLLMGSDHYWAFILPINRSKFIKLHQKDDLTKNNEFDALVEKYRDVAQQLMRGHYPWAESKDAIPYKLLGLKEGN
jgi:competence protein CoiA